MPVDDVNAKKFSFRYTSIGMISHAVKTKGVNIDKLNNRTIIKTIA